MSNAFLADEQVQEQLAELELTQAEIERADLEWILRSPIGRRFFYRVVFLVGGLERLSFEPSIKDGICSALHMARTEGLREGAAVFARQAQEQFPDEWDLMVQERHKARLDAAANRDAATATASDPGSNG